jgi:hypothetical protein
MTEEVRDGRFVNESGDICWYKNGLLHREDGPAIDWPSGPGVGWSKRWFLNGVELSEEQFNQWLEKRRLNEKLQSTLEEKPAIKKGKI